VPLSNLPKFRVFEPESPPTQKFVISFYSRLYALQVSNSWNSHGSHGCYSPPSFSALAFRMEYRNADARINSGDDRSESCRKLVSFCPVTPEFTVFDCVQQASISTLVSLLTFAWLGRTCYTLGSDTHFWLTLFTFSRYVSKLMGSGLEVQRNGLEQLRCRQFMELQEVCSAAYRFRVRFLARKARIEQK